MIRISSDRPSAEASEYSIGGPDLFDEAPPKRRRLLLQPLFLALVVLPTLLSILYFGLLADDVYLSESRFVVRSPSRTQVSPLGALLTSGGLGGPGEETNSVVEYVQSRDALRAADRDGLVRKAYGAGKANVIDRFGPPFGGSSAEQLYRYFSDKVSIETDATTQVARLTVRAFDPRDAHAINRRLLEQAERLVNTMSDRSRGDAVAVAAQEVEEAKDDARRAAVQLAQFRIRSGIVDPKEEAEVRLQMISKLQDELIATRTQLAQLQRYAPKASQIPFLRTREASIQKEIADQTRRITGADGSLSANAVRYQQLFFESELSQKQLAAAVTSLAEAKADARRKRAYIERIADPSLADYATEPRRLRGIIATLLLSLLAWGIATILIAGVREHRD